MKDGEEKKKKKNKSNIVLEMMNFPSPCMGKIKDM